MRVWLGNKDSTGKAWRPGALVEVARSELYRTVVFRVDRRYGTVFVLKEELPAVSAPISTGTISLAEVKVGPGGGGQMFLVDLRPLRNLHEAWLGQISWLLEVLEVTVDVQEFSDDDEAWNLVNRLEYRTRSVPMTLSLPEEELSVYTSLGERLPFLWPFEQLLAWALERPDAVVLGEP